MGFHHLHGVARRYGRRTCRSGLHCRAGERYVPLRALYNGKDHCRCQRVLILWDCVLRQRHASARFDVVTDQRES